MDDQQPAKLSHFEADTQRKTEALMRYRDQHAKRNTCAECAHPRRAHASRYEGGCAWCRCEKFTPMSEKQWAEECGVPYIEPRRPKPPVSPYLPIAIRSPQGVSGSQHCRKCSRLAWSVVVHFGANARPVRNDYLCESHFAEAINSLRLTPVEWASLIGLRPVKRQYPETDRHNSSFIA